MDLANVSSALSSVQAYTGANPVAAQVSVEMLDNAMDMNAQMGAGMIKMMENSVNPLIGGNIDLSV